MAEFGRVRKPAMNEIIEVPTVSKSVEQHGPDLHLTAETPAEMTECQGSLIAWMKWKVEACRVEQKELQESYEYAAKQKWRTVTLKRHADLAAKRLMYYEKILGALEAGYYIVPNFPVELFAIRTEKNGVKWGYLKLSYPHGGDPGNSFPNPAQELPPGEGEYRNPFPSVRYNVREEKDGSGALVAKHHYVPDGWKEIEFPITMSKPQIMKMVDRAMALKVFDEIGVLPRTKKEDPIIVGRIKMKTGPYGAGKLVSFILAWHINTRDL